MKKLVIFSLIAVLAAGVVFAQDFSIGGYFRVGADLLSGNTEGTGDRTTTDRLNAAVTGYRGRLNFSGTNDDETFGGFLRLQADATRYWSVGGKPPNELVDVRLASVWWRPIEAVKLQAGILDDFYVDDIVNTFGGNAEETKVHNTGTNGFDNILVSDAYRGAFGQEFDKAGAALTIAPIEGLAINIGIPLVNGNTGKDWNSNAERVYKNFLAQVQYNLNDIGRVSVAFRGEMGTIKDSSYDTGDDGWKVTVPGIATPLHFGGLMKNPLYLPPWDPSYDEDIPEYIPNTASLGKVSITGNDYGTLFAAFYLTALDNLRVNFGVAYTLPYTVTREWSGKVTTAATEDSKLTWEHTTNAPVLLGLGATFDLAPLNIAARLGVSVGGSTVEKATITNVRTDAEASTVALHSITIKDTEVKDDITFGVQLNPSYDLDFLKAFLNLGLTIVAPAGNKDEKKETKVGWHVNPYVEKTVGSGSFFAGIDLYSNGTFGEKGGDVKDPLLNWRIPCGMKFAF